MPASSPGSAKSSARPAAWPLRGTRGPGSNRQRCTFQSSSARARTDNARSACTMGVVDGYSSSARATSQRRSARPVGGAVEPRPLPRAADVRPPRGVAVLERARPARRLAPPDLWRGNCVTGLTGGLHGSTQAIQRQGSGPPAAHVEWPQCGHVGSWTGCRRATTPAATHSNTGSTMLSRM